MLSHQGRPVELKPMPATEADLWLLLTRWSQSGVSPLVAYLEKVRASPQMSKGSIWTFAQGYGSLRAFLIAAGIPSKEVAPQRWQRYIGVIDKTGARDVDDVDITAKKNRHKAKAEALFGLSGLTHAVSDALLIAEYGRRIERRLPAEAEAPQHLKADAEKERR